MNKAGVKMIKKKLNALIYPHLVLLVWAELLFVLQVLYSVTGFLDGPIIVLSYGVVLFLFFNIPFSVYTLIARFRGRFSRGYNPIIVALSIANILVSVAVWTSAFLLISPLNIIG